MTDKSKNDWDTTHNDIPYILEETVTFGKHQKEMLDAMKAPRELSDEEYADACLSYRHDFGLMTKEEQKSLMFQAKEWHRALKKASEK